MTNFTVWTSAYLLFVLLVGCTHNPDTKVRATIEYIQQNPSPIPDFVSLSRFADECVEVNQDAVWETGDTVRSLQNHLTQVVQVTIDNQIVLDAKSSINSIHLSGQHIYDDNGEIIGSTGGPITVCADSSELAAGIHLAKLEFTSTSGKQYEYSWVFELA